MVKALIIAGRGYLLTCRRIPSIIIDGGSEVGYDREVRGPLSLGTELLVIPAVSQAGLVRVLLRASRVPWISRLVRTSNEF